MFEKIKNFLMATTLERIKNIAIVIIAFSLFTLVSFLAYDTFFDGYERLSFDEIKVVGESKVEIPKKKVFYIHFSDRTDYLVNKRVVDFKNKLNEEFNDFNIETEVGCYSVKVIDFNVELKITFKSEEDDQRFEKFMQDNFGSILFISDSIKDNNFEVNEEILLKNALDDAKNKAEKVAEENNIILGRLKKFDEDSCNFDLDYKLRNEYVIKSVEVTYEIK